MPLCKGHLYYYTVSLFTFPTFGGKEYNFDSFIEDLPQSFSPVSDGSALHVLVCLNLLPHCFSLKSIQWANETGQEQINSKSY